MSAPTTHGHGAPTPTQTTPKHEHAYHVSDWTIEESYINTGIKAIAVLGIMYIVLFLITRKMIHIESGIWFNWLLLIVSLIIVFIGLKKTKLEVNEIAMITSFGEVKDHTAKLTNGEFLTGLSILGLNISGVKTLYAGPTTIPIPISAITKPPKPTSGGLSVKTEVSATYWIEDPKTYLGLEKDYSKNNAIRFITQTAINYLSSISFDATQSAEASKDLKKAIEKAIKEMDGDDLAVSAWGIKFKEILIISDIIPSNAEISAMMEGEKLEEYQENKDKKETKNMNARIQQIIDKAKANGDKLTWQEATEQYFVQVKKMQKIRVDGDASPLVKAAALRGTPSSGGSV